MSGRQERRRLGLALDIAESDSSTTHAKRRLFFRKSSQCCLIYSLLLPLAAALTERIIATHRAQQSPMHILKLNKSPRMRWGMETVVSDSNFESRGGVLATKLRCLEHHRARPCTPEHYTIHLSTTLLVRVKDSMHICLMTYCTHGDHT